MYKTLEVNGNSLTQQQQAHSFSFLTQLFLPYPLIWSENARMHAKSFSDIKKSPGWLELHAWCCSVDWKSNWPLIYSLLESAVCLMHQFIWKERRRQPLSSEKWIYIKYHLSRVRFFHVFGQMLDRYNNYACASESREITHTHFSFSLLYAWCMYIYL